MRHNPLLQEYLLIRESAHQYMTAPQFPIYYWKMRSCHINNSFTVTVRKRFDNPQKTSETCTINDECKNFIAAHMEEAAECISTKLRVKR